MLCLSGFELCSRWVPLFIDIIHCLEKFPQLTSVFKHQNF